MLYEDIYQKFIGKGKVQALNIKKSNGSWVLKYKEGKKIEEIKCADRESLDRILIEFGGKNPETCSTDERFLVLDNTWTSEDINDLGHRIVKIKLSGARVVRQTDFPITIPEDCGSQTIVNARRKKAENLANLALVDKESIGFTLAFKKPEAFDNLCKFIFAHSALSLLAWHVATMGTESRETGDQCVWRRIKAGDGTKRMVLELIGVNGNHYTDCVRQEVISAAGDMFFNPCQRISVKKKKEQTMEICMFAAEDGKIDMSKVEV